MNSSAARADPSIVLRSGGPARRERRSADAERVDERRHDAAVCHALTKRPAAVMTRASVLSVSQEPSSIRVTGRQSATRMPATVFAGMSLA
jgi:hypothetical protein